MTGSSFETSHHPLGDDATEAIALPSAVCDRVTRLATAALDAPMASVAVAEGAMLYVASCRGFPGEHGPERGSPFGCPLSRHVFLTGEPLVVEDVAGHVLGRDQAGLAALGIGAYCGVPLREATGRTVGMLSVFAHEPRHWTDDDRALLEDLAATVLADVEIHVARSTAAAAERDRASAVGAMGESEERYRLLFEANPQPAWVYDVDTLRFLAVNEAATRAYGWTREEFLAMTILDIRPDSDQDAVARRVAEVADHTSVTSGWRHRTRDGQIRDVFLMSRPVPFGSCRARIVIVDDITERRRAEEGMRALEAQLRQAQKMEAVGQLAGGIAHDFNNLLTAIKGYAHVGLLGLDEASAEPGSGEGAAAVASVRSDLREIAAAADRAASLTAQLLAFSRRQVLQPVTLDLNARATAMEGMVRRLIGEHIDVRLDLRAHPGHVRADPSQVEQVLLNLVLNARDAMPGGGRLTIGTADESPEAASAGDYVALVVRDTGVGMDEATMTRVFEPFFTTKEVGKGTGLGLSTVYGIVKQSGGDVRLESAPGRGTAVTVFLPAADGPAVAESDAERSVVAGSNASGRDDSAPGERATVLVVEDEPSVRQLARAVLEREGYRVLAAADGVEALVLLARHRVEALHVLLTDVVMPGMSGPQLAAEVARLHPEASVVYMSGYADDAVRQHGGFAPGTVFLAKPFELDDLAETVRGAVRGAGKR